MVHRADESGKKIHAPAQECHIVVGLSKRPRRAVWRWCAIGVCTVSAHIN
jgi:hypothetical protein